MPRSGTAPCPSFSPRSRNLTEARCDVAKRCVRTKGVLRAAIGATKQERQWESRRESYESGAPGTRKGTSR